MDYRGVGAFLESLRMQEGLGARALEFAILCAARSGEVRGARWSEFDLDAGVWTIPAERMKAQREHRVPLSKVVLDLLNGLPRMAGTDLVFPSPKNISLSDMTLTAVIRRMDKAEVDADRPGWRDAAGSVVTAHGFRSSFRDWAGEASLYPREVIEHALAHQLKDKAEAAYARGSLFDKRRCLMDDWSAFCAVPKVAANVTPIRSKAA